MLQTLSSISTARDLSRNGFAITQIVPAIVTFPLPPYHIIAVPFTATCHLTTRARPTNQALTIPQASSLPNLVRRRCQLVVRLRRSTTLQPPHPYSCHSLLKSSLCTPRSLLMRRLSELAIPLTKQPCLDSATSWDES